MPATYGPTSGPWMKPGQKAAVWKPPKGWNPWPGAKPGEIGAALTDEINNWANNFNNMMQPQNPGQNRGNAYRDLINQMLNQQRADFAGESVADKGSRDAAIKRVLVSYGQAPDLEGIGGDAKGVLQGLLGDQQLVDLINKNTAEGTSVKARMAQANEVANRQIGQVGASRGTLRSGDTGYRLGQQAMAQKQTEFDTLSQALGDIEGSVGSFAANERARQRALADAEMQANLAAFQFADDTDMSGAGGSGVPQFMQWEGDPAQVEAALRNYVAQQQARQAAAARAKAEAQRRAQQQAAAKARARYGGGGGGGSSKVL